MTDTHFSELSSADLRHVVQHLPFDVRDMLSTDKHVFLGGGFIREIVAGNAPVDIDLFTDTLDRANVLADDLIAKRGGAKISKKHVSRNAITIVTPNRLPVQIITRWLFADPKALAASFDFTVCQAVIWRIGKQSNSAWRSCVSPSFYRDLAGRNLVYTEPVRDEEAGGSMVRVLKFLRRGYRIQVTSLGGVMGRVFDRIDRDRSGLPTGQIITGLLREVDPLSVIDGFDVMDEHEPVDDSGKL